MHWMLMPLRRYAEFSGRSRRKEYWMFILFMILLTIALTAVFGFVIGSSEDPEGAAFGNLAGGSLIIFLILTLIILIPSIAVQVRRFHDQDKSGWFVLLNLIPYIGGIVVLVFMCLEGTRGPNRYGPDPKGENPTDVFS